MKVSENVLAVLLEDAEIDERAARWDYSGRGMYGRTCFGFTGNVRTLAAFFTQLGFAAGQKVAEDGSRCDELETLIDVLAGELTTDSMGLDTIFYFPRVEVIREEG